MRDHGQQMRRTAVEWCYDSLGWSFLPLVGKRPIQTGWQQRERETRDEAAKWADDGNIGVRTGAKSGGLVVIDVDEGGDVSHLELPQTVTVVTGSGGRHYYYRSGISIRNSAGKLGKHVDIRGDGGQVVFVGSVHPKTQETYEFLPDHEPWTIAIADLPQSVADLLASPAKPAAPAPRQTTREDSRPISREKYVSFVVRAECGEVAKAVDGTRNDTLNRAAFRLGQFVGGGHLSRLDAENLLRGAASQCGLSSIEASRTIDSGMAAGEREPADIPEPKRRIAKQSPLSSASAALQSQPDPVLIPGAHKTPDSYVEIGNHDFAEAVVSRIPDDLVYRRASVPGEVNGEAGQRRFNPINHDAFRLLCDRHVRLAKWATKGRGESAEQVRIYINCQRDHAGLVLAQAARDPRVRDIRVFTTFPIYLPGWRICEPGYADGVYYDQPPGLADIEPETDADTIREALDDMVADFPFKDHASRENYFGLLLTPLIRPAIQANAPLHLIMAPLERTGKSKLAEEGFGGVIQGAKVPAMQAPESDEEFDKRITASLMAGDCLLHLDNIREFLDSASLASLLTAQTYRGRVLGSSKIVDIPNGLTVVGTGNNVRATGEIAKRAVPISLQPDTDAPELRSEFRHPDFFGYVMANRRRLLGCLLGMIRAWADAGCRPGKVRMGGFNAWADTVGGIMSHFGYHDWMTNASEWRDKANPERQELRAFVAEWARIHGTGATTIGELLDIVKSIDVFSRIFAKGERSASTLLGFILSRAESAPVGDWRIVRNGTHPALYTLVGKSAQH